MKAIYLPFLTALFVVGTECFTRSTRQERVSVARKWKTFLSVLAEAPKDQLSSDADAADLQPIRRLRRDKKEPLIAIVGRPNVVSVGT